MITFSFFSTAANKLSVRFVNNRRKAELNLGVGATASEIEDALYALDKPRLKARLKTDIAYFKPRIEDIISRKACEWPKDVDVKFVRDFVGKELGLINEPEDGPVRFTKYFQLFIDRKTVKGTIDTYRHSLARISAFDPNVDSKSFEDIDLKWLTEFEAFCAKTANKNARNIHLRNIRAVFNNAIDFEVTSAYPFRRFKIRPEATRKRSLSVEELRELFTCPTEPYAEIYRDMFKLIFMLIGINGVDLHGLKSITKDGRIEYRRAKTHKLYSIKVEPEAMEIIEKYKGNTGLLCIADRWSDYRNFRHQCNNALHLIGAERNKGGRLKGGAPKKTDKNNKPKGLFPDLTMYAARHSWATIAAELDVPDAVISQALGHSGSNSTTEIYIKRNQKKVDEANRRVLDWVLYGKR